MASHVGSCIYITDLTGIFTLSSFGEIIVSPINLGLDYHILVVNDSLLREYDIGVKREKYVFK